MSTDLTTQDPPIIEDEQKSLDLSITITTTEVIHEQITIQEQISTENVPEENVETPTKLEKQASIDTPKLYKLDSISDQRVDLSPTAENGERSKYEPTSEVIIENVTQEDEANEKKETQPEEPKGEQVETLEERIKKSNELKNAAAAYVKGQLYEDAIKIYESAFFALKPSAKDREDENFRKSLQLQNALFNNLSLCYSQIGKYRESVTYATRVLYVDKHNVKALFRVATGLQKLGEPMKAYECVKECIAAHKNQNPDQPMDQEIHKLYLQLKEACKEQIEEDKKKQKEVFSKMFGNQSPGNSPQKDGKNGQKLIENPVLYGLCTVPSIFMGFIVNNILKEKGSTSLERSVCGALSSAGLFTGMVLSKNSIARSILGLLPLGALIAYEVLKKK